MEEKFEVEASDGTVLEGTLTDTGVTLKTPEQVEKELIEKAKAQNEDVLEMACKTYHIQLQRFKSLQHLLKSGRSKMRVLNLIMEYPLNDAKLKAHTEIEQELAMLACNVLEAKFLMIFLKYQEDAEKLMEAQNSPLTEETENVIVEKEGE